MLPETQQPSKHSRTDVITTTLFDLIAMLHSVVETHEDEIVISVITHLLVSGQLTWRCQQAGRQITTDLFPNAYAFQCS